MKVPYFKPYIGREEEEAVLSVLRSGWLTMGPVTEEFEAKLRDYLGVKEVVAVSSCTAALHLSLLALKIGEGDEVITTPFTFAATGNVIMHVGARPVFVDIEMKSYTIDPEGVKEAITERTKAIIPVDYAGHPYDVRAISEIAEDHGLFVIEDAAHALGAEYEGKKVGSLSTTTCFSFYPTKNITTGEGGAIATDDERVAERLRLLRLHGMSKDAWKRYTSVGKWYYEIEECGWKYNMTDLQAAIGIKQLERLDRFIEERRRIAKIYNSEFDGLDVITPKEFGNVKHAYHLYPLLLKDYDRDEFIRELGRRGIGCSVHFIPLHLHPFYRKEFGFRPGDFPRSEWVYEREVSLPLYPGLTDEQIRWVVESVKEVIG